MATGAITKRKTVPSIMIDKDFIQKFGIILESEINVRKLLAESEAREVIIKREDEIKRSTYYKEDDKSQVIAEMRKHEEYMHTPHVSVVYALSTDDNETIEFNSADDILNSNLLPKNIRSLSARVCHYNDDFVDISVSLDNSRILFSVYSSGHVSLSSKNEAKLLLKVSELNKLFDEFKSGYHYFLYYKTSSPLILLSALSVAFVVFYVMYVHKLFTFEFRMFYFSFSIACFLIMEFILKYSFPFYEFNLSNAGSLKKGLRIFLGSLSSLFVFGGIYDVVKFILFSVR